jgi:hypothetical protein
MFILLTEILSLNIQIDVCPDLAILLVDHRHRLVNPKKLTVLCDWHVNLFVVFVAKASYCWGCNPSTKDAGIYDEKIVYSCRILQ